MPLERLAALSQSDGKAPAWKDLALPSGPPDLDWRADLTEEERQEILHGVQWDGLTDEEAESFWKRMSRENRWEIKGTLAGRDGSFARQRQRVSDNADPRRPLPSTTWHPAARSLLSTTLFHYPEMANRFRSRWQCFLVPSRRWCAQWLIHCPSPSTLPPWPL